MHCGPRPGLAQLEERQRHQAGFPARQSWSLQAPGPLAFMACRLPSAHPLCAWNKGAFFQGGWHRGTPDPAGELPSGIGDQWALALPLVHAPIALEREENVILQKMPQCLGSRGGLQIYFILQIGGDRTCRSPPSGPRGPWLYQANSPC